MISAAEPVRQSGWRWFRRATLLILALLLGTATTVAVSWRIAGEWTGLIPSAAPTYQWSAATGPKWMYTTNLWPGGEERMGILADERASRRTRAVPVQQPPPWSRFADPFGSSQQVYEQATGWPMPAMASAQVPGDWTTQAQPVEGIDLGPPPPGPFSSNFVLHRMRPTRLLWPGFAVNSLLSAALWWIALLILAWLIRFIRRWPARRRERLGRCPKCGYDLRGEFTKRCSECGWKRFESDSGAG